MHDKQLEKYGYNKQDLSWIMMLENLAKSEQRSGKITWKFYPFPKDANGNVKPEYKELQKFEGNYLEIFEKKVQQSPELYKITQEFFNLRQRNIIKRIMEFPVFSAKEKAEMAENYYYLTFQPFEKVMKRLDTFGAGAISTKGIKQTQGTFEAFMSPFDATVAKDLMMLAPSEVSPEQLKELNLSITKKISYNHISYDFCNFPRGGQKTRKKSNC